MSKPDQAVIDARVMAENGYNAREIAEALSKDYGKVSQFTVRGWIKGRCRRFVQMYKKHNKPAGSTNASDVPSHSG